MVEDESPADAVDSSGLDVVAADVDFGKVVVVVCGACGCWC